MPQVSQEPVLKIGTKLKVGEQQGHVVAITRRGVEVWVDDWGKSLEFARDVIEQMVMGE